MEMVEPFRVDPPVSGAEHVTSLYALEREAEGVLAGLDFFAPQGAFWSPAEHVRHLRKSAAAVTMGLRVPKLLLVLRFGFARGGSRSFVEVQAAYVARINAGAKAPPAFQPGRTPLTKDHIMQRWHQANRALAAALDAWSEPALDRYRLPHPLLGKLTVREMLSFTVYHTAHHLRRIAERSTSQL